MNIQELSQIIFETSQHTIYSNREMVTDSITTAVKGAEAKNNGVGEIIGAAIAASINMSVQMSVAATLSTLAKLGLITLDVENLYLL